MSFFLELVLPTTLIITDTLLTQPMLKLSSTHIHTFKMMELEVDLELEPELELKAGQNI